MRIICIGAHPDDSEIGFGGTAAMLVARGDAVKFLSVTNGDAGHHLHSRAETAALRNQESQEAAYRLGIAEAEVLSNHDGELTPSLDARHEMVRQIRRWEADVVLTHRPWDYHPDHRYTSQLVQDSAYLVMVPNICPDVPALARNPVFLSFRTSFICPLPSRLKSRSTSAKHGIRSWMPWTLTRPNFTNGFLGLRATWTGFRKIPPYAANGWTETGPGQSARVSVRRSHGVMDRNGRARSGTRKLFRFVSMAGGRPQRSWMKSFHFSHEWTRIHTNKSNVENA